MLTGRDDHYTEIILAPLRKCADYLPKMGGDAEVNLDGFVELYGADPLYHWMGFDSPLMFAAHKAAGGMTSVYRQLGIGCERLFRQVLRDELGLDADQATWSYEVLPEMDAEEPVKARVLSLDGRVELADVADPTAQGRIVHSDQPCRPRQVHDGELVSATRHSGQAGPAAQHFWSPSDDDRDRRPGGASPQRAHDVPRQHGRRPSWLAAPDPGIRCPSGS